jgi:1-pyrroline-5-carboxylate dehydrogenase
VANNTEYGLTGALYTNDRGRLNQARAIHVGNLLQPQVHRGHGGRHPRGFNMSGTDSKAGGPDYCSPRPRA